MSNTKVTLEQIIRLTTGAISESRQLSAVNEDREVVFVEATRWMTREEFGLVADTLRRLYGEKCEAVRFADRGFFEVCGTNNPQHLFINPNSEEIRAAAEAALTGGRWEETQPVGREYADFSAHDPFEGTEFKAQKDVEDEKAAKAFFSAFGLDAEEIREEFKKMVGDRKPTKEDMKSLGLVGGGLALTGLGFMIMGVAKLAHDHLDK